MKYLRLKKKGNWHYFIWNMKLFYIIRDAIVIQQREIVHLRRLCFQTN